jgi:hypothetical protein
VGELPQSPFTSYGMYTSIETSVDPGESPQPPLERGAISPKVPLLKGDLGGFRSINEAS